MEPLEILREAWRQYQQYHDSAPADERLDRDSFADFMSWTAWGFDGSSMRGD